MCKKLKIVNVENKRMYEWKYVCKACKIEVIKLTSHKRREPLFCSPSCGTSYYNRKRWKDGVYNLRRKYHFNEKQDEIIKSTYGNSQVHGTATCLSKMSIFKGYPRQVIYKRADQLDLLISKRDKNWSKEELEIIERYAGDLNADEIYRRLKKGGFDRTLGAVKRRIFVSKRSFYGDYYSAIVLSQIMGCSSSLISSWIRQGFFGDVKSDGKRYFIRPFNVAKFIFERSDLINGYRINIPWLVALLDEFRNRIKRG